jgi:hypothetical protein
MSYPSLALCIPAYNAAKYLPRLLESAISQQIPFDENILCDAKIFIDFLHKSFLKHNLKTIARVLISKISNNRYKNWINNTLHQLEENQALNSYNIIISSYAWSFNFCVKIFLINKKSCEYVISLK